jgi:DNA-binding CsgD family transcriptional regulator
LRCGPYRNPARSLGVSCSNAGQIASGDAPVERARTLLLVGQIHGRQRRKDAATKTLREALAAFEDMGVLRWAQRARAEVARCTAAPRQTSGLTPLEQRVAALAAQGMTNRDVAAALFISAKTVEANLSRVHRKLGIHSRAELGRRTSKTGERTKTVEPALTRPRRSPTRNRLRRLTFRDGR